MGDRHWMYHRLDDNDCLVDEFKFGVEYFLDFSFSQFNPEFCSRNRIRCPCRKCMNGEWHRRVIVLCHSTDKGFMNGYVWGESSRAAPFVMEEPGNDPIREMVMDAMSSHGI
ncbi:hypothetical protein SLE2022_062900 [Rubroshorea leprosula]